VVDKRLFSSTLKMGGRLCTSMEPLRISGQSGTAQLKEVDLQELPSDKAARQSPCRARPAPTDLAAEASVGWRQDLVSLNKE